MPMLLWLPMIFMGAFLEMARIANENRERSWALFGGVAGANVAPIEPHHTFQSITHVNAWRREVGRN